MDGRSNKKTGLPPKGGKVNDMCREWLVREDGAFAYHLQAQEINQHYKGNKNRNQQVREDFPCALDEQIREQQLAEQAAAVYQRMLSEQEEVDEQMARELAERLEREEADRRRTIEMRDENMARQLQVHRAEKRGAIGGKEYVGNQPRRQAPQMPLPKSRVMEVAVQQRLLASNGVDRDDHSSKAAPSLVQPKPSAKLPQRAHAQQQLQQSLPGSAEDYHDLYTEPYQAAQANDTNSASAAVIADKLDRLEIDTAKDKSSPSYSISTTNAANVTSSQSAQQHEQQLDHLSLQSPLSSPSSSFAVDDDDELRRLQQEERDAEYARRLQEEESNSEENIMIRDRMLAMEAQDKELARLLQDREKAKARRAKERAKQRALQKKMALEQQSLQFIQGSADHQILLPDDSYSNPIDLLPPKTTIPHTMNNQGTFTGSTLQSYDDDTASSNYSLPIDHTLATGTTALSAVSQLQQRPEMWEQQAVVGPVRPTQLDLRSTTAPNQQHPPRISKPRYPDPPANTPVGTPTTTPPMDYQSELITSSNHRQHQQQHTNIAMAIDPTYGRRQMMQMQHSGASYYQGGGAQQIYGPSHANGHGMILPGSTVGTPLDNHSNTSTPITPLTPYTSTSSNSNSSPPYPNHHHHSGDGGGGGSPVPPYMPIQGQRRAEVSTSSVQQQQPVGLDVIGGAGGGGKARKGGRGSREGGGGGCKQQ